MNLFEENEEIVIFKVEKDDKVESFLFSKDISGRLFRKLYKKKHIYINGKEAGRNSKLNTGDLVSIYMEDESNDFELEKMDLNIIYEDYDLLILNKAPYMVVHPTKSHESNTLSNGIAYYFHEKGINRKIRFVNRLDMNTSGILIVAKNQFAHQQISLQFERDLVEKRYRALVEGRVKEDQAYIDLAIAKEEGAIKMTAIEGDNTLTHYRVIERYRDASLLDIRLFSGKTHQIRVHMKEIGHPIIGDSLYNKESAYIARQALQSYYLKIKSPRRGEDLEFSIDMPKDFKDLIEHLKNS